MTMGWCGAPRACERRSRPAALALAGSLQRRRLPHKSQLDQRIPCHRARPRRCAGDPRDIASHRCSRRLGRRWWTAEQSMSVYSRPIRHAVNPVVMSDERARIGARRVTGRSPHVFIESSGNSLQNHAGRANSESWRHQEASAAQSRLRSGSHSGDDETTNSIHFDRSAEMHATSSHSR